MCGCWKEIFTHLDANHNVESYTIMVPFPLSWFRFCNVGEVPGSTHLLGMIGCRHMTVQKTSNFAAIFVVGLVVEVILV